MTKAAALLLAGSLALAACASDENERRQRQRRAAASSGGDLKIGLAYDTGGRGDRSFNDSAYAGVEAAIKEHGGKVSELSPNADASNRADLLTQLADEGYNPIIAVGFAYGDDVADGRRAVPRHQLRDRRLVGGRGRRRQPDRPAVRRRTGLVPRRRRRGAEDRRPTTSASSAASTPPLIHKFEAGYVAGAKAVKPDITIDSQYISPDGDFSGFNDPAKGQIVAQGMYDAGADIVYHAAGGSGLGVFQAAAASGERAIGVDSDQYKTVDDPALQAVIMTSMLKRVDNAVQAYIGDFVDGKRRGRQGRHQRPVDATASAWPPPVASSTTSRARSTTTGRRSSTATSRSRPTP